jgi:DNA/RNA-binding domain of Phe-tRNA-synthetase-like protein
VEFSIQPEVFERFPGMAIVVAVATGVDNRAPRAAVDADWQSAWEGALAAARYGNAQSHPRVAPWREHFKAQGLSVKEYRSSIEALLRRALKGGEPFRINPLVDFYNAVSLRHVVPAGAFDLAAIDTLGGRLELRLTRAGDTFHAFDSDAVEALPPGEVAYAAGSTTLTRHFVWRQSHEGLVTPETAHVFLVAEVLAEAGPEVARLVLDDFRDGLERFFGVAPYVTAILDDERRTISIAAT